MFEEFKIIKLNGKQYIPNLKGVNLKAPYRGKPEISDAQIDETALKNICPMGAININPISIDIGKYAFCGECSFAFPKN